MPSKGDGSPVAISTLHVSFGAHVLKLGTDPDLTNSGLDLSEGTSRGGNTAHCRHLAECPKWEKNGKTTYKLSNHNHSPRLLSNSPGTQYL